MTLVSPCHRGLTLHLFDFFFHCSGDRELQPGGRDKCKLLEPLGGARSSFRYVNAGNWVARRGVADRLLADWLVAMGQHPDQDDQHALQQLMFARANLSYSMEARSR